MCNVPLENLAKQYLFEFWGLTNCEVPVIQSKCFRNKLGLFECFIDEQSSPLSISKPIVYISSDVLKLGTNFLIKEVLKHELCHYAMLLLGKPYLDGHPFFEKELERIGAFSSRKLHTFFVASCSNCLSYDIFPKKCEAKTFLKRKCFCKPKNKNISLFADVLF